MFACYALGPGKLCVASLLIEGHGLARSGTAIVFSAIYYKALSRRGKESEKAVVAKASSAAAEGMKRHAANAGSVSAADFDRMSLSSAARTSQNDLRESA